MMSKFPAAGFAARAAQSSRRGLRDFIVLCAGCRRPAVSFCSRPLRATWRSTWNRLETGKEVRQGGRIIVTPPDEHGLDRRQAGRKRTKNQARTFDLGEGGRCGRHAEAGGYKPELGVNVVGVLHRPWSRAGLRTCGPESVIVTVLQTGVQHHQILAVEVSPLEPFLSGKAMPGWRGQDLP